MIAALLPILGTVLGTAVKRIFPDPADDLKARELENQLRLAVIEQAGALERSAAEIIKAEAQSESWLARCWRPIVMLTFTGLIVARWLGWSAPGITEPEILKLWSIVEFGLGGYVVGRSVEKIAPALADAVTGKGK